jgi:putative nucleotidyltransferase with HDIG domain
MSTGPPKRKRSERAASLALPPGLIARVVELLRRGDVLLRLAMCMFAALAMWGATGGWVPPLNFRLGHTPARDLTARVDFEQINLRRTEEKQTAALANVAWVYRNDPQQLDQLQQALKGAIFQVLRAESYDALDMSVWTAFLRRSTGEDEAVPPDELKKRNAAEFMRFREKLADDTDLKKFEAAVARALADFKRHGLIDSEYLPGPGKGNQSYIRVLPVGEDDLAAAERVDVEYVRVGEAVGTIRNKLRGELGDADLADHVFTWIEPNLRSTLTHDVEATRHAEEEARKVAPVMDLYVKGNTVAPAGKPIDTATWQLLHLEYQAMLAEMSAGQIVAYSLACLGMYFALYVLCGYYIYYHQRGIFKDLRRFATLLACVVATVIVCYIVSRNQWPAEAVPLLLFGMTITVAYERDLALLLSAAVALLVVVSSGLGLVEFVILAATVSAAIILLGRVRSRTKLIYVALCAATVSVLTTLGVGTLGGQPIYPTLTSLAAWNGFSSVLAGLLMTGLLPFIESLFGVQTEISLLELGDPSHPLLQELVRRAPGTYNHSINVASIADAAAEAIAANALLVRVGAYFHDIGKMFKPNYFIENQAGDLNRHESLMPAMSTLVIIAHVKDGADLARQHHLPQSIIDFIEQHHGTTLVEYFYNEAARRSEADPDAGEVDESAFRYPGPKPQTKEAAVLMLADCVEGASRTLVDPTPARIESLVDEIAMKRLMDDQFDACGLTLQELRVIEDSLVKSLTAVYHGRVKYPDQRTA